MKRTVVGSTALVLLVAIGTAVAGARNPHDWSAPAANQAATAPAFKFMVLINKQDGVSYEAYERYFFETHLPYVLAIPGLRGYKVNLRHPEDEDAPYDGISEFWFDDRDAFDRAMAAPETAATLEDAATFLMPPQILLVDERVIIDPNG